MKWSSPNKIPGQPVDPPDKSPGKTCPNCHLPYKKANIVKRMLTRILVCPHCGSKVKK